MRNLRESMLALLVLCFAVAKSATASPEVYPHYYALANMFRTPQFAVTFRDLEGIANASSSTQDFLSKISVRYPEFKSNFTLVYKSQSLQDADLEHPRMILYSPNGLILTLETRPNSSQQIEVMEFNVEKSKFDFKEISFVDGRAKSSENPAKCFACHAGRPIWDAYHKWSGVFGSEDDYFVESRQTPESLQERRELKAFLQKNSNPYLKALEVGPEDYFLDSFGDLNNVYNSLRRNAVLTFILSYYNYFTLYQYPTGQFSSHNLSFTKRGSKGYFSGASIPLQVASRTLLLGFSPNAIYQYGSPAGNDATQLMIPQSQQAQYETILKSMDLSSDSPSPLGKCLTCHQQDIPLNDVQRLKGLFSSSDLKSKILSRISEASIGTRWQMPPTQPLTEIERKSIIDFISALQ